MDLAAALVDRLTGLPPGWLYLAAGALLTGEVGLLAGLAVPAASTMLTVGFLARTGYLDLIVTLVVCTLAAFAGDQLGYLEGRFVGTRIRGGRIGRWIGADRWRRTEAAIIDRGGPAIVLGRWTPFVRTLVPRIAGGAGMPYRRFMVFNAFGVAVWVPGTILVGYAAGASYPRLAGSVGPAGALALVAAVVVGAGLWLRRRLLPRSGAIGYGASGPPTSVPVPPPAPAPRRRLRLRSGSPLGQPRRPAGPRTRRPFPVGRGTPGRSVPDGEE
ncbi:DedA family protein [Plantactinospora solaniradicis]|uniref:DedA family protein n=1 Tax=Plantactinospora solaniradicis TaxID=1723736 RepID=A0ABW1KLV0_9ACTN